MSRPAVSQHLKVLQQAGLVVVRSQGTRRLYSIEPRGIAALRGWLDGFWDEALSAFKEAAEREALRKGNGDDGTADLGEYRSEQCAEGLDGAGAPAVAWRVFTERMGTWWPLSVYKIGKVNAVDAVIEPRVGGRWYERGDDGSIATLTAATEPGSTVVMATFALDGPERCSGLPVQRYSATMLADRLGAHYRLTKEARERHRAPSGTEQSFCWAIFQHV